MFAVIAIIVLILFSSFMGMSGISLLLTMYEVTKKKELFKKNTPYVIQSQKVYYTKDGNDYTGRVYFRSIKYCESSDDDERFTNHDTKRCEVGRLFSSTFNKYENDDSHETVRGYMIWYFIPTKKENIYYLSDKNKLRFLGLTKFVKNGTGCSGYFMIKDPKLATKFEINKNNDGTYFIKDVEGNKYLSLRNTMGSQNKAIIGTATTVGETEKFLITEIPSQTKFKC